MDKFEILLSHRSQIQKCIFMCERMDGMRNLLEVIKMFYVLIVVVVAWVYTAVKTHQIEHFKWINLYIN